MAGMNLHLITNAAVYLDGNNYVGRCEEVDLGSVKATMTDFQGLGMVAAIELPAGFDKVEGKIIWNSQYEEAARACAVPFKSVQLQLRSQIDAWNAQGRAEQVPLVTLMTVLFKEYPLGGFKPREKVTFETSFSATYVQQKVNGREVFKLDCMSNIYSVNGQDQLTTYRRNLGIS